LVRGVKSERRKTWATRAAQTVTQNSSVNGTKCLQISYK